MGKASERRFNKEKLLFLAALAALAGAAFFLLETRPEELASASPITRTPTPGAYPSRPAVTVPSEPAEVRPTPFMPVKDPRPIIVEPTTAQEDTDLNGNRKRRSEEPTGNNRKPEPLHNLELVLEYVGIVSACGQTYGLLRGPKGVQLRVQAGDVLETWGCSVAAIADQSIVLRAKNGRIHELRNSRCPKLASNEAPLRDSQRQ